MFVDYNKAFNSLYHNKIWAALATQRVPKLIIQLLENIYSNSLARIKLDKTGNWFPIKKRGKTKGPTFTQFT